MRTPALFVSIAFGVAAAAMDAPVHANIQSPPEEACAGKKVADACTLPSGEAGRCQASKCNQLDYSQGSPPKAVEVDCTVCIAGGPPPGPGPAAVSSGGEPSAEGSADTGASTPPATTSPIASDPAPSEPTGAEPPASETRCAVQPVSAWGEVWALGLLFLARRRRLAGGAREA